MLPGPMALPWIPGRDIAGIIHSVAADVKDFQKGDRVWATNQGFGNRLGTCAELCAVQQKWLYPLPDEVEFDDAAAAALVGITAHLGLVQKIGIRAGQSLFVRGAGGAVGTMVIQMALALGARVIASAGSDQKVTTALELGAADAFNYRTKDTASELKRIATDGVDVAWDTTREPDFQTLVPALAEGGQIVLMAGREAQPPFPVGPFYVKQCSMHGIIMLKMSPEEMRAAAMDLNRWLGEKKIRPQIAIRLPLAETARAHQLQESATIGLDGALAGKILLHP